MKNSTFLVIAAICMVALLFMFNRALNLFECAIKLVAEVSPDQSDVDAPLMRIEQNAPIGFVVPSADKNN